MHQRKAISPIIAIVILLLVTIAIGGAGYSYLSVYWTTTMSKQIQLLDSYCTSNRAAITLRNIGTSGINNSDHEAMVGLFEQDENTVGMWHFDETDGNASLDSSGQGNTGTIYGNTVLLMHFDEDGNATLDSTSYGNTGSLYGDTVLLMHFDEGSGNPADSTSYGNHGDISGHEPAWKTSGCKSGNCLEFDGDYVKVPHSEELNITDALTLSAWVKIPTTQTKDYAFIVGKYWRYYLKLQKNTDRPILYLSGVASIMSDDSISLGQWHHIVGTYNKDGGANNVRIYVDGELKKQSTAIESISTTSNDVFIGAADAGWPDFNGTIDEVAIYSKALSQEEITTLYQAGRAKFIERKPGRSGNAIEFDGDGDYVEVADSSSIADVFDNGGTWSFWVIKKGHSNDNRILNKDGLSVYTRNGDVSDGKWKISYIDYNFNTYGWWKTSGYVLPEDTWTHVAVVFNSSSSSNNPKFYVNGTLISTSTATSPTGTHSSDAGNDLIIGDSSNHDRSWNGTLDEVAVYSRALTEDEVKAHYEAGKAKFIERVQGRFGNALELDGNEDYVDVADDASLNLSGKNITLSAWVYIKSFADGSNPNYMDQILSKDDDMTDGHYSLNIFGGGTPYLRIKTRIGGVSYTAGTSGTTPVSANTWYHVVGVNNGTDNLIYINGDFKHSANSGVIGGSTIDSLYLGYHPHANPIYAYYFNGTIDEVLVFNRSLSAEEIQAQLKPACSCTGNSCQCGELTVTRTLGQGYFHPYFDNETLSPGQSITMTDYNCLGERCEYKITTPMGSYEATVFCS